MIIVKRHQKFLQVLCCCETLNIFRGFQTNPVSGIRSIVDVITTNSQRTLPVHQLHFFFFGQFSPTTVEPPPPGCQPRVIIHSSQQIPIIEFIISGFVRPRNSLLGRKKVILKCRKIENLSCISLFPGFSLHLSAFYPYLMKQLNIKLMKQNYIFLPWLASLLVQ